MAWYKITEVVTGTPPPALSKVTVAGKSLCLVYYRQQWFALASKCPHAGADLSRGWCNDNGRLVCPFHRYEYHLSTGKGAPGQNDYVRNYPVEVRPDGIYVEIKLRFGLF